MGRVVRRVPATWQHPKNDRGNYVPLFDGYNAAVKEWDEGAAKWAEGYVARYNPEGWEPKRPDQTYPYSEWACARPAVEDYIPDWPESERTHWQMYEDTSEGTPISPVMDSPEALARWLYNHGSSIFGGQTTTYAHWLRIIKGEDIGIPVFITRDES